MLHPDYSDAEIRLEVRNFGVTKNADGSLRLEEKGTVYNEMVASMANGSWQAWRAQNHAVYGTRHPLSYNQGGEPAGIRTMTPADIRRFHAATPPPRQHGHGGRVPEVRRARRRAGALRPRADDGRAEGRRRARPIRSTSCRQPARRPRRRDCASTSTRTPTRSSPAPWRWCGRPAASSTPPSSCWPSSSSPTSPATPAPISTAASSTAAAAQLDTGARSVDATVQEWGGHPVCDRASTTCAPQR